VRKGDLVYLADISHDGVRPILGLIFSDPIPVSGVVCPENMFFEVVVIGKDGIEPDSLMCCWSDELKEIVQ
jgi:hypothetical protein